MKKLFMDSSAFYALMDKKDKHGMAIEQILKQEDVSLVTTNYIFAETISLVTKRLGKKVAIQVAKMIRASELIQVEHVSEDLQEKAWKFFEKYQDKDFDLIDATSFLVCKAHEIKQVLSLDHHFVQMGFEVLP